MSRLKFAQRATMTFTVMLLLAGCVSQQKYDALQSRYDQLNQTMSSEIGAMAGRLATRFGEHAIAVDDRDARDPTRAIDAEDLHLKKRITSRPWSSRRSPARTV